VNTHRAAIDLMLHDIRESRARPGWTADNRTLSPDAVFFTGDMASTGKRREYVGARSQFGDLLRACGLDGRWDRLFIVPGNHDADRDVVAKPDHALRQTKRRAEDLLNENTPYDEVNQWLSDPDCRDFKKFAHFSRFISGLVSDPDWRFERTRHCAVTGMDIDGHAVVVMGFNSALLSFKDLEQGQLLLGEGQVCDAIDRGRTRWPTARLRIALMHHPLYWLAEKDLHEVQPHLHRNCDMLLRGHLHCSSLTVQSTPDYYVREMGAGASMHRPYCSYNLTRVCLESGHVQVKVRIRQQGITGNWGNDTVTYPRDCPNGWMEFDLPLHNGWALQEA